MTFPTAQTQGVAPLCLQRRWPYLMGMLAWSELPGHKQKRCCNAGSALTVPFYWSSSRHIDGGYYRMRHQCWNTIDLELYPIMGWTWAFNADNSNWGIPDVQTGINHGTANIIQRTKACLSCKWKTTIFHPRVNLVEHMALSDPFTTSWKVCCFKRHVKLEIQIAPRPERQRGICTLFSLMK